MSYAILTEDCKTLSRTLDGLSNDELDQILNDDTKIEEILSKSDQTYLKEIQNEKETVIATNASMAEMNLAREPELTEKREKLQVTSIEGEELSKRVEEKLKILRDKNGDLSLETALALLRTAASEMEEESDSIAKKFMDEGGDLDDFLEQFLARRRIMHLRLVKADKMSKIIQRGNDPYLGNMPTYTNPPPLSMNSSYFPGIPSSMPPPPSVPYPTGPLNMPMPPPYANMNYFQNHY